MFIFNMQVGERILCRHPFNESKRAYVVPQRVVELLECYWPGISGGYLGICSGLRKTIILSALILFLIYIVCMDAHASVYWEGFLVFWLTPLIFCTIQPVKNYSLFN